MKRSSAVRELLPSEPIIFPSQACTPWVLTLRSLGPRSKSPESSSTQAVKPATSTSLRRTAPSPRCSKRLWHGSSGTWHTPVVELSNGHLINGQEVPDIALREILSNALVHRSLNPKADTEEVRVRIFPDRISVENPGGLYGITLQRLQEYGERSRVNDRLYDVCTHVTTPDDGYRVIEGEGSGIYTAQEAVRQAGLKPIQFVVMGSFVLPRLSAGSLWLVLVSPMLVHRSRSRK